MKIACLGDLHLRDSKPRYRIDDFKKTQKSKFRYIMNVCKEEGVKLILAPGDIFDRHTASYALVSEYLDIISFYGIKWGVVFGQHDLRYHSQKTQNTPLNVLIKSRYVTQLRPRRPLNANGVCIWGKNWEQSIPNPKMDKHEKCNILVGHQMVVKDKKLWPDQTDYTKASTILNKHNYDLFVFGDNHNHFTSASKDGRYVINCGSLMRTDVDQEQHIPCFYIFDSNSQKIAQKVIPVEPFDEIMDLETAKSQNEKRRKDDTQKFINKLKNTTVNSVGFKKNMQNAINENRDHLRQGVVDVIEEALPEETKEMPDGE